MLLRVQRKRSWGWRSEVEPGIKPEGRRGGKGKVLVFVFVSQPLTLYLVGNKLNKFSPGQACFAHDGDAWKWLPKNRGYTRIRE